MKTISNPDAMRAETLRARAQRLRVGFVPTMGALHEGHLSLVRRSRAECGLTAVSIFVNPAQFGHGEVFARYPRDLDRDGRMLEAEGVDVLFAPAPSDVYKPGHATWVEAPSLAQGLCGAFRPGHFRGVATIVAKLFNVVRPDAAYFGQKDAQQAALIRRMAADLDFRIEIVGCPTVREPDGLAMSSRNAYLSEEERREAPTLHAALKAARDAVAAGVRSGGALRRIVLGRLEGSRFEPQYVEVVRSEDLSPIERLEGEILIAAAAHLGATRLIDNVIVQVPAPGASESTR